jgi:predicted Zn-dependent peptidase
VLRAMAKAFFNPAITAAGMKAAAQDSAVVAAQQPFDSSRTLQDALFAQIFSAGPAHYAPLPDPSAFATLTQGDVQAFAARAFQRGNTIVSLAGNIVPSAVAAITGSGSTLADAPFDSTAAGVPPDASVSARVAGLGLGWKGPAISDTRAATAMDFVADYLFDPDRGTVVRAARGAHGLFVNGQFVTLHDPGVLLVTLSGESAGTFQQTVLDAVAGLQTPLDPVAFAGARKAFLYHILSQIQTPAARADNQGWYAAEGNAAYAPGDVSGVYLDAVNSLDPQFVAQTVRAYLQKAVIVRLIQSSPGGSAT